MNSEADFPNPHCTEVPNAQRMMLMQRARMMRRARMRDRNRAFRNCFGTYHANRCLLGLEHFVLRHVSSLLLFADCVCRCADSCCFCRLVLVVLDICGGV